MKLNLTLVLMAALLLLFSCKKDEVVPPEVVVPVVPVGDEQYLTLSSDYIFDQSKLLTFELTLPETALAEIDADPAAEEYVEGSLTFEGETISPVGIRYKGSIGAFVDCLSGSDIFNPSGSKTCTKLSMKIKMNWNDSQLKFYGLKKLQFHSQNNDPSQMRERLGYWLFREMGVPGPRSVHARLIINGEYMGLFALTEQVDGRFTDYNFADGDGNLYKEIWPLTADGMPYPESVYLSNLKTNEEDNPTATIIRSFAEEVAAASGSAGLASVIESRMDLDEIISYAVVDRMIRNDDGAFHWYCFGVCAPHNFYWYEEPGSGKLHLIPWDLDHAFENIQFNVNPVTAIVDGWGEITASCAPFPSGLFGIEQRSAACDKLTGGWADYTTEYEAAKTAFKNGAFSLGQANTQLDAWVAQITAATAEADAAHDDALSVAGWNAAIADLKAKLDFARTE